MTYQFEYGTVSNPEDAQQLGVIINQCFNDPSPSSWQTYSQDIVGLENFRIVCQAGKIIGGLAILHMGQWYGCECVPMAGIAAVGIAPEHRGTGAVFELLKLTLKELYARGVPLSTLYAATQRPYRKVGYEQAGICCSWEILTNSIQLSDRTLPMQPVIPICQETFYNLYHQKAKVTNGHLDRNHSIWKLVVEPRKESEDIFYAYLIGTESQPEGYIIFTQKREENSNLIYIRDWAVLTAAAARRFWTFLADHRSMVKKIRWRSSTVDPLMLLLPEQTNNIRFSEHWMLRVIDVSQALAKRGYPLGIETELHLEVFDDLLPENNGKFVLSVAQGRGEVTKGGRGELQLDVCGLAPLYTGLFTPHQLKFAGKLEAKATALLAATQIFADLLPWMPDHF
ncbi:MAG: GNAT family N-acetyltransferase [Chroococcidiopsidaceae cyanobacterium CP_BM_ER_R8_30]|nr:GNAT family N-acetyltransferase [Chroococcidiopsidaceae cyanobacterium CP_BM_ER_R8_30]